MYMFKRIAQETDLTRNTSLINVYKSLNPDLNKLISAMMTNISDPCYPVGEPKSMVDKSPDQSKWPGCVIRATCTQRFLWGTGPINDRTILFRAKIFIYNVDNGYARNVEVEECNEIVHYANTREEIVKIDRIFDNME